MEAPSTSEIVDWIDQAVGRGTSPEMLWHRYRMAFGLGMPRPLLDETEKNFMAAMVIWAEKAGRKGGDDA